MSVAKPAENMITGQIVPGSKFSKVKLGMSVDEVVKLIGPANDHWVHPTENSRNPSYRGDDGWLEELAYTGEGQLSFEGRGAHRLLHIEVEQKKGVD
jgi:hypothetical protein